MSLKFSKMQGIGNDFVVLDRREQTDPLSAAAARRIADRHFGVGCDQVLSIETATDPAAAFAYGIWNQDGSAAGQCGNGVRCVVAWLARAGLIDRGVVRLQGPSGLVGCELLESGMVRVNMGAPNFAPASLPFLAADEASVYLLRVDGNDVEVAAVSIGNPHVVIRVEDIKRAPVNRIGALLESHARFPDRVNVGFVQLLDRGHIALRVFERGVGETLACGTGACAAAVVGIRLGALEARVVVALPGGELLIDWAGAAEPVWMTGAAEFVYEGIWHEH